MVSVSNNLMALNEGSYVLPVHVNRFCADFISIALSFSQIVVLRLGFEVVSTFFMLWFLLSMYMCKPCPLPSKL